MSTLADKLLYLANTKEHIRQAIIDKGVNVLSTDTFRSYPDKIQAISQEPELKNFNSVFYEMSDDFSTINDFNFLFTEVRDIKEVPNVPNSNN